MRVEEMFENLACCCCCTWLEAIRSPQHHFYKCPLTSEKQRIHQTLPQVLSFANTGKSSRKKSFFGPLQTHWGRGSATQRWTSPLGPWHIAASFPAAKWRLGRAPGWQEEQCVNLIVPPVRRDGVSSGCLSNLCHSACVPMFYKQNSGVFSHDFLALEVDD